MKPILGALLTIATLCCASDVAHAEEPRPPTQSTASAADSSTQAQPERTRPTPPRRAALSEATARAMVDSLIDQMADLRGLVAKRQLQIHVAPREWVRKRLEEIIEEENVEANARQEELVLKYLGLVPEDVDLLKLYKDLVEEQLAGMYDIDRRVLVLADWLPPDLQALVVTHELVHALQDQHFSLRVRKKLGFETPDAEAAWHALIEGDATASMLQAAFQSAGRSFDSVMDSLGTPDWASILSSARDVDTQQLLGAPNVVREALSFPYEHGLGFVTELFRVGGWKRVDEAYLRPPTSTEQILHPERFLSEKKDEPIQIEPADARGILGAGYAPSASMPLGEFDLFVYLKEFTDVEIAAAATEGWGGAWLTLYSAPAEEPDALVIITTWDTDEDAVEFFGAAISALSERYPEQTGDLDATSEGRITWNVDPEGRYQNIVRLVNRRVQIVEQVPAAASLRVIQKLDRHTKFTDPTPHVRAMGKVHLPWNRVEEEVRADSALTLLKPPLPHGWMRVARSHPDSLLSAQWNGATLDVVIDREAQDRLGISGYAHELAAEIQRRGSNVYIHKDVGVAHDKLDLYEHIFSQTENGGETVHYVAVADLRVGFAKVILSQPADAATGALDADFYELLRSLEPVPWRGPAEPSTGGSATTRSGTRDD